MATFSPCYLVVFFVSFFLFFNERKRKHVVVGFLKFSVAAAPLLAACPMRLSWLVY